jgi:hypothetical protein
MSPLDIVTANYFEEDYAQLISYLENTDSSLKKMLNIPSMRRVKFSAQVAVYSRGPEFTNEDKGSAWCSSEEFALFKSGMKTNLKRMKNFEKEDDSNFCYRGLVSATWLTTRSLQHATEYCTRATSITF